MASTSPAVSARVETKAPVSSSTAAISFVSLGSRKEFVPQVARFSFERWPESWKAYDMNDVDAAAKYILENQTQIEGEELPIMFLALQGDELLGFSGLETDDMHHGKYKDVGPWLCTAYVRAEHRSKGVGGKLIRHAMRYASDVLGHSELYLYTHELTNVAMYEHLGWKKLDQFEYMGALVYVMRVDFEQKPKTTAEQAKPASAASVEPVLHARAFEVSLDSALLRFGPKAPTVAEALHMMSLSLVKIVLGYLVCPTATADALPTRLFAFGSEGKANGQFNDSGTVHIAISPDKRLWVSDGASVQVFSLSGEFLFRAAKGHWSGSGDRVAGGPGGIAFDADGQAFIVHSFKNTISVCKSDGTFLRQISLEKMYCADVVASDQQVHLLFVTASAAKVHVLKLDGSHVRNLDFPDSYTRHTPRPVRGIAVRTSAGVGECAVADHFGDRIVVFDYNNGKVLRAFGNERHRNDQTRVSCPEGLAIDSAANFVVCRSCDRVAVFSSTGEFITDFGRYPLPSEHQLKDPTDVCIDTDDRIYIADAGNRRVQVFAFYC